MAGKTEYKNKWQAQNCERISLIIPKGSKATIQEAANQHTKGSINGYVNQAINERLERDGFQPMQKQKQSEQEEKS
ncbi:MAG: hypothetical protein IJZ64_00915 [Ruminococcus sp.]|nr:hypothetical protein [Ruminococcus sp.]